MAAVRAGEAATAGVYVSLRPADLQVVSGAERVLKGQPGASYTRFPLVSVLVLGPVFGGVFAISLPFLVMYAFGLAFMEYLHRARTYDAGETAPWGVYLGTNRIALAHVGATGERIRGRPGTRFRRIPTLFVVILSPLLGLLYAVAFPLVLAVAIVAVLLQLVVRVTTGRPPASATWPFSGGARSTDDRGDS